MPSDKRARQRAGRAARMAQLQQAQRRRARNRRGIVAAVIAVIVIGGLAIYYATSSGGSSKKKVTTNTTTATTAPGSATTAAGSSTTAATATAPTAPPATGTSLTGTTPCPPLTGATKKVTTFAKSPPECLTAGKSYTATLATNLGNIAVALDTTKTPMTANNFAVLSLYHYYDGTALFRTDTSIGIIQGGSPHTQSASDPGPGYTIKDEGSKFTYAAGDLVMARTSAPNSAGAQFFFCVNSACSGLDSTGTYVVFGHVTTGLPVLQKILGLNVELNNGLGGAPKELVTVKSVTITQS